MFRPAATTSKLMAALGLLNIGEITIRNENGDITQIISAKLHASSLFTYLNMARYLDDEALKKAVAYLAASRPFACNADDVFADLKKVHDIAAKDSPFNAEYFIEHFAAQDYFSVDDIVDLIVFLQQTAFDRQYGVERDRLQAKPWMEANLSAYQEVIEKLGVTSPQPPIHKAYHLIGIMGASSTRVKTRLEYFNSLHIDCHYVLALSGNRELSKGLDQEDIMEQVANAVKTPVNYVKKTIGADSRDFLDGVTETMMVNYLIKEMCPHKNIGVLDSAVESDHWRATTKQGAMDVAKIVLQKIQSTEMKPAEDGKYHIMIIAEQPYPVRMAMQVQREFDKEVMRLGLEGRVVINVEGSGPGLSPADLNNIPYLTRVNSELGALMAERYNDARALLQQNPDLQLRDTKIIMFSSRDKAYEELQSNVNLRPGTI